MKRYRFRLDAVLRVRRQEEDVARAAVVAATVRARAEAEALVDRDRAYADATRTPGSGRAARFVVEQQHRAALGRALVEQRGRLHEAEQQVHAARAAWSAAAARVGALERLDGRARAEHTARALKEDEMVVDDLVVSRVGSAGR